MSCRWNRVVIAFLAAVLLPCGMGAGTAQGGCGAARAEQAERTAAEPAPAMPSEAAPTYEEWLDMMQAANEGRAQISPSPMQTAATAAATATPDPEEMRAAEQRSADAAAGAKRYDEILSRIDAFDADLQDTLLRLQYYRYLRTQGYACPAEAEALEQSMLMDFTELSEINADVEAWLYSPDTAINYPVVYGVDNVYYLHHLFDESENATGTLFSDMNNDCNFTDQNTVIYGHHMRNGSMFASLVGYKEQAYYDAHPAMLLYLPGATYLVELFSGAIVQIDGEVHNCFTLGFADTESFLNYIDEAKAMSTFRSDVEVGAEDRIITLCTCTYEVYDARYIVQGKLTLLAGEEPLPEDYGQDAAEEAPLQAANAEVQ